VYVRSWIHALAVVACFAVGNARAAAVAGESSAGVTVSGRVVDDASRRPLSDAEVVLAGTGLRTYTDEDGRFRLEGVARGAYTLSVTRLGYKPLRIALTVGGDAPAFLPLALNATAIPLQEVTVMPGAFSFRGTVPATRQTLRREDIESMPQIADDVFRAVNRLPGLASNDYAAHFGIRGGRHDETLILLDGLELYAPYHLRDFNEGAISIIDAETIDGVELLTGGFPARYGNKRSGVFDIQSRTPEPDAARYSLGLSSMTARAMGRGPLAGGGSWLAFARGGAMNLVFKLIDQGDLPSPQYEDVFAKASLPLSVRHALTINFLQAGDRYKYEIPGTTGFNDSLNTREAAANFYGNWYAWATLHSAVGAHAVVQTTASTGLLTRKRDGYERYVTRPSPLYAVNGHSDYSFVGLAQDWTLPLSDRDILNLGVDVRGLRNDDAFQSLVYQDPNDPSEDPNAIFPVRSNTHLRKNGSRFGLYMSNRWRPFAPIVLELGGRFDHASYTGDRDFSPRANAALDLGGGRTLRLGWGDYRQMQGIEEVAALDGARYYRSELSEQSTVGFQQTFGPGTLLRLEGYYKMGSHLRPVYRNWKGAIDAFPEVNEDHILVYPKRSTAKGVELYFDHQFGERIAIRASYALSSSREQVIRIDNLNSPDTLVFRPTHPGPQDQRHAANLDFTYRLRAWSLNGALAYHSGWPTTLEHLVPVTNANGDPDVAVRPLELYAARLPDYLRFDMRTTRRWALAGGDLRLYVEVINLTNHSNVFGYDYFARDDASGNVVLDRGDETWFTILPAIGAVWNWRF
jgi:CarboxypepD_reg-like domain/TonB dependent receptor-like, beta-barrel/TonB-dependent Receptor Plug Domain